MLAAMAVEVFVWVYIFAFLGAAIIAISLLIAAARRLAEKDRDKADHFKS